MPEARPSPTRFCDGGRRPVKARPRHTDEQRRVITLERGPARVLAGAGSGKTHTMTEFVARKVRDFADGYGGVAPERILAITFTVKAAEEMRERLLSRIGESAMKLTVSNFHRLAFGLARENALKLGIPSDAPVLRQARAWLMVLDDLSSDDLSLRRLDLSNPATVAENTMTLLREARNELVGLEEIRERTLRDLEDERATDEMKRVFGDRLDLVTLAERFEGNRARMGLLQYQDMVEMAVRVLEGDETGTPYRDRYDLVVVDEFQDTNPAQMRLVELLADGDASKVVVIGDDLQSIFNFQGAAIRNIQNFEAWAKPRMNGEANGIHYSLTKNFRSGRRILSLANHIAGKVHPVGSPDEAKVLEARDDAPEGEVSAFIEPTDVDEAKGIAARIRDLVGEGGDFSTCAVLIRRWSQSASILSALSEAGIPCEVVRGGDLLARPEVRVLVDFLRLVHEPGFAGDSLIRTLSRHPRLFSDGDLRAVFEHPGGPWTAMLHLDGVSHISEAARGRLRRLRAVLSGLEGDFSAAQTLPEFIERAVETTGLGREVRSSPGNEARLAEHHLAAFREVASEFGEVERLGEFLRYIEFSEGSRSSENAEPPEVSENAVVLTTIHGAKGLEFDHVFIPGLSASLFPNSSTGADNALRRAYRLPTPLKPDPDPEAREAYEAFDEAGLKQAMKREAEEEEGRLFYVAATRARETLVLSRAGFYTTNKKPKKSGAFWEMAQDSPSECSVPKPEEPPLPDENPNLPVFGVVERPEPDSFVPRATSGTKADEARIADELGVSGYEDALHSIREDIRNIPEVERPEYILPPPEVHSPSSLMEFEVCGRRYYYKNVFPVVDLSQRGDASRDFGTVWHKWVEDGMVGEEPRFPEEPEESESPTPSVSKRAPLKETEYGIRASTYPLHESHEPPKHGPARMVEVPFTVEVGGSEIKGRIDAVFVDEDGGFHIIDWKSGRPSESYKKRLQLPIYALAANKLWGIEPENMRLAYVFAGGEKIVIDIGENFLEEKEAEVEKLLEDIRAGRFEPKPSKYACKYCPVFGIGISGCPGDEEELKRITEERDAG
ncbi:MAG: ATP-dependent helicase [Rubrobacter sp.]|nr:ATP-dependent helicase [Rubrobacter sp.]